MRGVINKKTVMKNLSERMNPYGNRKIDNLPAMPFSEIRFNEGKTRRVPGVLRTLLIFGLAMGMAAPAFAQDRIQSQQDVYDADNFIYGFPIGSFIYSPILSVQQEYEDNIFRTQNNAESDFITVIRPTVNVRSFWDAHALEFNASGRFGFYEKNQNEDYEDFSFGTRGRLDLLPETYLYGDWEFRREHEPRSSVDNVGGSEPTEFDVFDGAVGFVRALSDIKLYLETYFRRLEFEDSIVGGALEDNSDRDRDDIGASLRLTYGRDPASQVFFSAQTEKTDYQNEFFIDRSSTGYEFRLGFDKDLTGRLALQIYTGYIFRDYESSIDRVDDISVGGSVLWNATDLSSVLFSLERTIEDTTFGGGAGATLNTRYAVEYQHRFTDSWYWTLGGEYEDSQFFVTAPLDRTDRNFRAQSTLRYAFPYDLDLEIGFRHERRESDTAGADFANNRIFIGLRTDF